MFCSYINTYAICLLYFQTSKYYKAKYIEMYIKLHSNIVTNDIRICSVLPSSDHIHSNRLDNILQVPMILTIFTWSPYFSCVIPGCDGRANWSSCDYGQLCH